MDKDIQRRLGLRDINRNNKFHSITFKHGEILKAPVICESDDMIFCFDAYGTLQYWLVKQKSENLTTLEHFVLVEKTQGVPHDKSSYKWMDRGEETLRVLTAAMRFCLG